MRNQNKQHEHGAMNAMVMIIVQKSMWLANFNLKKNLKFKKILILTLFFLST